MLHSSGKVIHLDDSDADVEEVGSDVDEVVTWDHELHRTKTFATGFLICYVKLPKAIGYCLVGVDTPPLVVDEYRHLVLGTARCVGAV
jgi:hypothetical protein